MNTIGAREMMKWTKRRKNDLLQWMEEQELDPRNCARITLLDDGTCDVEQFIRDEDGRRQLDPFAPDRVLTIVINFTPTKPCPEPHSV